jgi:ubiquinone/menaquinone biosynthesis C-methylase UbiE
LIPELICGMNRVHHWLCRSAWWKRALDERIMPWVLHSTDLGSDVIEIGPGPGLTTDYLRARCPSLTSVEIDSGLAHSLQSRMRKTNVHVINADATQLPFADGSFSGAVSFTMLHHVPSPALQDKLLSEVRRVLRPGGTFAGMDSRTNWRMRLLHIRDTLVIVDPASFEQRLQRAGFTDIRIDLIDRAFRFQARASD